MTSPSGMPRGPTAPATSDCPERAFLLSLSFVRAINGPRLQA